MRRGLMRWDAAELPAAVLTERLTRLRGAMRRERLDAFLVYTNLVRPAAVCWLTGFTPYWSEGALLVLGDGAPVFATALSKRVATWIESTNPVSEILTAPRPGKALGQQLAAAGAKRVGVLELDTLPTALSDDLAAAAPVANLVDGTAAFATLRSTIDDAERALLLRADAIARDALAQVDAGRAAKAGTISGEVEKHARLAGAEEAYIAIAPDLAADRRLLRISKPIPLGESFAVRVSIAYKGCWVRRMRTYARASNARAVTELDAAFDKLVNDLGREKPIAPQLTALAQGRGTTLQSWTAESTIGSYPLQVIASSETAAPAAVSNEFVVLTAALTSKSRPWLGAAPIVSAPRRQS